MEARQRLVSLDIFRGLTIAAMILVNNPGSWSTVYPPLLHADWHGVTPTDWIFPNFLFIVGVAIALAIGQRRERGADRRALIRKILWRTLLIFAIGVFLNGFPYFRLGSIRIPGVLQRIALVYGAAALLFVYCTPRQLFWVAVGCLLGYWALMSLVPVPGGFPPNLDPETNLGAWLDRLLLNGHLWSQSKTWDPEGLLSTLPAVATGLSGVLTGVWLRTEKGHFEKVAGMMVIGAILLALSFIWDLAFPINKKLWTSSYVLYTSGVALLMLGSIYWLVDIKESRWWTKPFVVYGMNALFVYVLSVFIAKAGYLITWTASDGSTQTLQGWLWESVCRPMFNSPYDASLAYALTNVTVCLAVAWILYWRRIFIRI
ncbi:MAG: DUF1624 domain-containing protein [Lewinella sp.]|nr:DUF1624 domain-containing protein [Lewinella sp.]